MTAAGDVDEALWDALAAPSRRLVLDSILAHAEATPTMIAKELPFSRQAVTKHLDVLDRAGLVQGHRRGREIRYVVDADRLAEAARAMSAVAAQWDRRLARIKEIAEAINARRQVTAGDQ